MRIAEFLSHLNSLDVKLWAESDQLRCNAPKGVLTPALQKELENRKEEILLLLKSVDRNGGSGRSPIVPLPREGTLPLSFAQERLWFLYHLFPESPAYNIPILLRLAGPMDRSALQKSLQALVDRHESLRTCFPTIDDKPVQVIRDDFLIPFVEHSLRDLPEAERETAADKLIEEEILRPFDLTHGPVIRATLLSIADQDNILLVTLHHIITDGWSRSIIQRDLAALYNAQIFQQTPALPALPIQYADYAHWQRQWLTGAVLEPQLGYWRKQLADVPRLEMPTDRLRPPVQTYSGGSCHFKLTIPLTEGLHSLSRKEGVTLATTLLAGFQVLLGRYTGQTDIAVGSPIANRTHADIENLVGFFVNTLVMRTDLTGDPTFREALSRVHEVALEALGSQDLPFEQLVDDLKPQRDFSRNPLFQVMFAVQNAPREDYGFHGLTVKPVKRNITTTRMDLECYVWQEEDELQVTLIYNTNLFDGETIERAGGYYQRVLAEVVREPTQRLSQIALLEKSERQQLLVEWNATERAYPKDRCLHQRFEAQVARTPTATAVVFGEEQLTYAQLNARANQLAALLQQQGVGPDTLVGLCVKRSVAMLVGLLGILKAGAAYVPLDPSYPSDRLHFMIKDAQMRVIVTHRGLPELLHLDQQSGATPSKPTFVDLDALDWHEEGLGSANPRRAVTPQDLMYVIYTSGSTGTPKGVMIAHQTVGNFLDAMQEELALTPQDTCLALTSISFDIAVLELYGPLLVGGCVHLISRDTAMDGTALVHALTQSNATLMQATPVTWQLLVDAGWPGSPSLRALCGGEALAGSLAQALLEKGVSLWNMYGPTETTVWSALHRVSPDDHKVPIGRPIANTQLYVLDAKQQLVPVGVPGELYIGGEGLSRGYWRREDLTRERFIPHPFDPDPLARLYRTGDRVRYRADGTLEFLGRVDHQVKLRGFRIELGEIEAVLTQHPGVQESVAVVREDEPREKRLVAYIIPSEASTPSARDLKEFLQDKLPAYMVPSAWMELQAFPLTPNGKVDRKRLPEPEGSQTASVFVAPRTPEEEILLELWKEVLHVETLGIHDNFFELGGHSLLATKLLVRIQKTFQQDIPLRLLFEAPTIAAFAEHLMSQEQPAQSQHHLPLVPIPRDATLPLSFAQQRLWFLDQFEPDSSAYHVSQALRLTGPLNYSALEQSLNALVARHESLRTTFATVEGTPFQVIAPALMLSLPVVDLQDLSAAEQETTIRQRIQEDASTPFDLSVGPLIRTTLLQIGPEEHIFLLTLHHIITDGWSMGLFFRELGTLYQAACAGQRAELPPLPIQYADYSTWQRQYLQGEVLETQLAYWRDQLTNLALLDFPTDHPRPAVVTHQGQRHTFTLSSSLLQELKSVSSQVGTTLFMTLLAGFHVLLARYTGQKDIAVGTPVANRSRQEVEGLIGFFANTLVLRTDLSGNPTFRQVLQQVRAHCLQAYAHQDIPFEKLVEELQPVRDPSRHPLFQVMFQVNQRAADMEPLPGLACVSLAREQIATKFDLTVALTESSAGLRGGINFNTELFEVETMTRLSGHFAHLLEALVQNPDERIGELSLFGENERTQLLVEWNATQRDYPKESCIHQRFEAQVARTPQAVAVVFEEEQLTYAELNARANQLAHYLERQGVGPEVRVGLCVERSVEMLVGLLGILKAAGAYVPLDPNAPLGRLAFMLKDADLRVILTQEKFQEHLSQLGTEHICLDADWPVIGQKQESTPVTEARADSLAYVIYTSGSTGRPKGVEVEHRQVLNYVDGILERLKLPAGSSFATVSPLTTDLGNTMLYPALAIGGTLHIISEDQAMDSVALGAYFQHHQPDCLKIVPSHLASLLMGPTPADTLPQNCLVLGGEMCPWPLVEKVQALKPGCRVINHYGPTETTVGVTTYQVEGTKRTSSNSPGVPIGRPLPNSQVHLLDEHKNPVPVGVIGEVHIGGKGLARGYAGAPELTAEKFIPHPYSEEPGARLFKTGDRAKFQPDGTIEFLGRIDHQVKLRGFRIELGEIEMVLNQYKMVQTAVVVVREKEGREKQLVAYVVPRQEQLSPNELRQFLKITLPEYMVPKIFVMLEDLPLTPNGKVDRKTLPAPVETRPEGLFQIPHAGPEQTLASIWKQLLRLEQVGRHDNFFELGGDSILSIQMVARASQAGLRVTPKQIFQYQTIAELAKVAGAYEEVIAEQGLVTGHVALTPIQHWFVERDFLEPHHWNMAWVFEAHVPLLPEHLAQVVDALVEHHDALRLRLRQTEEGWRQEIVAPGGDAPFAHFDWSHLSTTEAEQAWELEAGRLQASLSLSEGPLIRVALAHFGSDQPDRLVLAIHHLAVDGISLRIVFEDLRAAYEQLQDGKPIQLPPKTTSFSKWSESLLEYARSGALEQEVSYWREVVHTPCAPLPRDDASGYNTVESTRAVVVALSREETQALLQQVPEVYHTQINDLLLTALVDAMPRWTGQENLLINLEGHGREDLFEGIDLSRTVGWFTSKFPVVLARGQSKHPGERLKAVKEHLRQIPNRGIGYGVLRYLTPDTDLQAEARDWVHPEVTFNYLGQFDQTLHGSELLTRSTAPAGLIQSPRSHRSSLVEIIGSINAGMLHLKWHYSENIHERATMEALANSYIAALRALIQHCQSTEAGGYTPSDFPLAKISQRKLDEIVTRLPTEGGHPQLADLYPLTPLQQGLWFHELVAPESRPYFRHRVFRLDGDLDPAVFRRVWQEVLAKHTIFQTSILWEGLDNPLQLVHPAAALPWEEHDWRSSGSDSDRTQLDAFLEADRARGLDLTQPPLTRLSLLRVTDTSSLLVWSYHHILLDRWSVEVVVKEVLGACAAARRGQSFQSARPRPYRDFVGWLQQQEVARAEDYWRDTLRGFSAPTALGVDQAPSRVEHEASHYEAQGAALSETATRSMRQWARQHQLTLNTLVQGAWAILLSRYSDSNDVVFGATVSGRSADLPGIESMVGLFINTLPVRAVVTPSQSVVTWLAALQDQQVASRQYEYSPLFEIQKWSEVPNGVPLFSTLLVFENTPGTSREFSAAKAEGITLQPFPLGGGGETTYPLTLVLLPGSSLKLLATYDTAHYADGAIRRLLNHFRQILEAMISEPEQALGAIPILTAPERQHMLVEWNDTKKGFSEDASIQDLFAAQVSRTPHAVAVVFGAEQLTYRELDVRANQLARYLRRLGVGPDVLVGLCVNRSLELVIGVLGILKAGGGYVPLDPTYPSERLCFMLEETRADIVVTQAALQASVPPTVAHVLGLDRDELALAQEPTETPVTGVTGEHLAYVIFTSGSTGKPKGVALCHRTLTNLMEWQAKVQRCPREGTTLQFASLSFDVSCQEIFSTLVTGGRLVMIPESTRADFRQLLDVLERERVERIFLPFVALQQLASSAEELGRSLPALREVITAGEQLVISDSTVRLMNHRPDGVLVNQYGPSESHVVTSYELAETPEDWPALPPIGRPIDNTQMYVLDAQLEPVPAGVIGHLYIGGTGLARGYANRPGLTAEKFVPDPFSAEPGARLYKTGDKARYQPDGNLEFLGRTDHQVKLRGYRVELGEIEAVLGQHPAVRETVVLVRAKSPDNQQLVAYVVSPQGVTPSELRQHLKQNLPEHMVPTHFVMLDTLPLTASGKVDRRALPNPDRSWTDLIENYAAPRNPIEEALSDTWAEVLALERVGVHDNFFDLGGHSLLAAKIVSRLRTTFAVDIPLRAFFDSPTIAGLSKALAMARQGEEPIDTVGIAPVTRDGKLSLSFTQERFWFLDQIHTERSVFNTPYGFHMGGPVQLEIFRQSVQALVDRHETLRTTFPSVDGEPHQFIAANIPMKVPVQNCLGLSQKKRAELIQEALLEEKHFLFDLAQGPLFRARLLRFAEDDHFLLLNFHHIIHDAWSLEVIIKDLVTAYTAGCAGYAVTLPALTIQYVDYTRWQRELLEGPAGRKQLAYWKKQLAKLPPPLPLPTDYARPAVQTFRGALENLELPAELIGPLRALNRQEGTTLFMVLLAALQFLLHRLTGTHDILVGSPIAGRDREELQGLIGCFLNTLVLRTDLSGDLTGRDLLKRVREVVLNAYENQDVPFEKLVAEVNPARDPSRTPIFQVLVNMHSFDDKSFPLPELSVTRVRSGERNSLHDMTLYFSESITEIRATLGYNADLFTSGRMKEFMQQLQCTLEQMVNEPDRPLEAYSLVTPSARLYLPDPSFPLAAPRQPLVPELITRWALDTPDHAAVRQGSQQWSYRDLASRAEKVGHSLEAKGMKKGTVVALSGPPSFGLIVGMLGVLQHGGVLLMIDPVLPDARKSLMLGEANAKVLVLLTGDDAEVSWPRSEGLPVVYVSHQTGDIESGDAPVLSINQSELRCTEGDPAYIFFTSGTTGKPKGIVGSHQSLSHFLTWQRDTFAITPADRAAQLTGLSFDVVLRDIFLPLISGGVLCLPEEADRLDGKRILQWLDREQITVLHTVPAVATSWLATVPKNIPLSTLRWVFFAGEPLTDQLVQKWRIVFSGSGELINLYGPTETTLAKCFYQIPEEPLYGVQSIGGPLPNTQVLILNREHQLCGIGELGEIVVRTPFRTLGPLPAQGLTSSFFQKNPYRPNTREDLYFTGDLGRYRPDGTVEILGRLDEQVKIRGVRVEPNEIMHVLTTHRDVASCVVLGRKEEHGEPELVAYVVPTQGKSVQPERLREYLEARLPGPLVPTAWVFLDHLPLTANGKVDRRALPVPDRGRVQLEVPFVSPRTPTEEMLVEIWQEVLKVERIGIHDNFFDLGGHSLLATRVVSRVRQEFHVDLKLMDLFKMPTIAELTKSLEGLLWVNAGKPSEDEAELQAREEGVV